MKIQEIKEAEKFLKFMEVVTHFLLEKLSVSPRSLKGMDLSHCFPNEAQEITLSTIFLTSVSNQILSGVFQFKPIEGGRVKELLSLIFEEQEQGKRVIKKEVKNGLKEWFSSIEEDESKLQHLIAFQNFCLDLFEVEYGRIPFEEKVNHCYLKGLLIKP